MNVIESEVLEVLSEIRTHVLDWGTVYTIKVKTDCYGQIETRILHFNKLKDAEAVAVGYVYNS